MNVMISKTSQSDFKPIHLMIAPVGLEKDRVIFGLNRYPVNRVVLLRSKVREYSEEEKLKNINYNRIIDLTNRQVTRVKQAIKGILHIEEDDINLRSFAAIIKKLNQIVSEIKQNPELHLERVYINTSTSNKLFAMAAYLFGCYHHELVELFYINANDYIFTRLYMDKNYTKENALADFEEHGETTGDYILQKVPTFPLPSLENFEQEILSKITTLTENFGIELPLSELLNRLGVPLEDTKNRMKISYHLKILADKGFLELIKKGRQKFISLTELGVFFGILS